jgi:hypothetical protein
VLTGFRERGAVLGLRTLIAFDPSRDAGPAIQWLDEIGEMHVVAIR